MAQNENEKEGIGCGGWIVLIVIMWIMYKYFLPSGGLLDNNAMDKPVTKAIEAIADGNFKEYSEQFIDCSTEDETSVLYYLDFNELTTEFYNITSEALERDFGSDYFIKDIEVVDREKYDVTQLYDMSKELSEAKNKLSAITDVYILNVKVTVSSEKATKNLKIISVVMKSNWKWKCLLISDENFANVISEVMDNISEQTIIDP